MQCTVCGQAMQPTIDDDDLTITEWRCVCGYRELPQQVSAVGQQQAPQQRPDMVIYLPQPIDVLIPILRAVPAGAWHDGSGKEMRIYWGRQA